LRKIIACLSFAQAAKELSLAVTPHHPPFLLMNRSIASFLRTRRFGEAIRIDACIGSRAAVPAVLPDLASAAHRLSP
jgi:hypothetical protein